MADKKNIVDTKNMSDEELINWAIERAQFDVGSYLFYAVIAMAIACLVYFIT